MTPDERMRAVAERLHDALTSGDAQLARELYADDLVVWHNHDRRDRGRADSLAAIEAIAAEYAGFAVSDVRLDLLADGYAERCVFTGTHRRTGAALAVDAMLRVWSDGTLIYRIEEYTDPAQGAVPRQDTDDGTRPA